MNYVEAIYDVTVAYSDAIVQSELDLAVMGACPKNVHFDIRKIPLNNLPTDEVELDLWLRNYWIEKEARLKRFYDLPEEERELDHLPKAQHFEVLYLLLANIKEI